MRIIKDHGSHRLICTRRNGTHTQGELGPGLPYHDLAHYVVEHDLNMGQVFFGLINEGYSMEQLGDAATIRTLPRQALEAEVLTRNLQGLSNGAVAQHDFIASVEAELARAPKGLTDDVITRMLARYIELLNLWEQVAEGAALLAPGNPRAYDPSRHGRIVW
ncbi:MAG: hypothetical protein ABI432_05130 [Flavobacteriales bacterium]